MLEEGQKKKAATLLEHLLSEQQAERRRMLATLPTDATSLELGRRLLLEARRQAPSDARFSIDLANLAIFLARQPFESRLHRRLAEDLAAVGSAVKGNGYRLLGQYPKAVVCLAEALRRTDRGTGDPVAFADILSYRVSLLRDHGEPKQAKGCAHRAIAIYRRVGEDHRAGRTLLTLAGVYQDLDDPAKEAEVSRHALALLDADLEPETVLLAHENLALFVALAGDPQQAQEILAAHPSLP